MPKIFSAIDGVAICQSFDGTGDRDDTEFVVAAREDIPWLLEQLRDAELRAATFQQRCQRFAIDEACAAILAEFMYPTMEGWEERTEASREEWRAILREKILTGAEQLNGTNGWLAQRTHRRLTAALVHRTSFATQRQARALRHSRRRCRHRSLQ